MDLRNQKEVEEMNKIRNNSTEEESLYGLQTGDGFLQSSIFGKISKRDTERKQEIPVSREDTQCHCTDIADKSKEESICPMAKNKESLLAKIKLMIAEQINILNDDLFNAQVESLKRRAEQVECTKTHKEAVKTSLKEVFELERQMDALLVLHEAGAVPQGEIKKRKLEMIDTTEENHNSSEVLAEEFEDPPQNPETKRGFCARCEGDWTVMDPYRK